MTNTPFGLYKLIAKVSYVREYNLAYEFTKEEWDAKSEKEQQAYLDQTTAEFGEESITDRDWKAESTVEFLEENIETLEKEGEDKGNQDEDEGNQDEDEDIFSHQPPALLFSTEKRK